LLFEEGAPGGGKWVTAGELDERTRVAAGTLAAAGVTSGDRLLWMPEPSVDAVVTCVAALRAGVVLVPVSPLATARELDYLAADVTPAMAVCPEERLQSASGGRAVPAMAHAQLARSAASGAATSTDALVDPPGGAPAIVGYTSGTTGQPKGALLSHENLLANARALAMAWRWTPDDRLVHALPLFHVHGLCVALHTSLLVGSGVVLLPRFDVDGVLGAADRHDATLFFGVPTMYHRLAAAGAGSALGRLRLAVSGSAPLAPELHAALRDQGVDVLERYGMTETLLTISNPYEGGRRAGTVGFPLPGVELCLDDGGEILVRGPQVCGGYFGRPDESAAALADGWFRTGDIAEVDDGYVRILGRARELVISGGYNVYPAEVEQVLARHPGVAEVAVSGTPSDEWGEVVTAWVVPAAAGAFDADALLSFAAAQLAPYKRPRLVRVVDALPRNAMGKLQRSQLA
jgi:malonyl-CoA/methylmalonyl-CoA synthetase